MRFVKSQAELLRTSAGTIQQIAYLVDMAKAEALDNLGEKQVAIELAERYLA